MGWTVQLPRPGGLEVEPGPVRARGSREAAPLVGRRRARRTPGRLRRRSRSCSAGARGRGGRGRRARPRAATGGGRRRRRSRGRPASPGDAGRTSARPEPRIPNASTSSPSGPATRLCAFSEARWTRQSPAAPRTCARARRRAPREPRPAEHVEDLLLRVPRRATASSARPARPGCGSRLRPCARGSAEVRPRGADAAGFRLSSLDVVPVHDVLRSHRQYPGCERLGATVHRSRRARVALEPRPGLRLGHELGSSSSSARGDAPSRPSASMRPSRSSTARASSTPATVPPSDRDVCADFVSAGECAGRCDVLRGPRLQPEDRLVEGGDELRPIAVAEGLDERAPEDVGRRGLDLLAEVSARSRARRSPRSRGVSPSRTAARTAAAQSPSVPPSSAASDSRSCSERNGSAWKSESSQRSRASASSGSSSDDAIRTRRSAAREPRTWSSRAASPAAAWRRSGAPAGCRRDASRGARRARGRQR